MSRVDERLAELGLTRNQLAARMADDEGWNVSSASESLGRLVSCLSATEPQPYLTFQLRELTAACKALRCSSDWLMGLPERTTNTATELSNFIGDIEALIPADCRNSRPDRLASVRAAVGMMAQKLAGDGAIPGAWDWVSNAPYGGSLLPENFVLSTAKPGTGAWAWEQMQRGPEVWVRRRYWPMSDRVHLVEPGLIVDQEGARAGKKLGAVGSPMWPEWLAIDDWELCAAPGGKEAKQAEFHALADSVSDTPFTATSVKDGPTEEQVKQWRAAMWGKQVNATPSDWEELSSELRRTFCGFAELCWQAAREGMVPQADIGTRERALIIDRDTIRAELTTARFCADETALKLTAAERRVGELEVANVELERIASKSNSERARADIAEAELERVKAELARSETRVTGLDGHVQCVADIAAALDKLEPHRVSTGVKGLAERVVSLLAPASDEVTEASILQWEAETDKVCNCFPGPSLSREWLAAYATAARRGLYQPSSNPLQLPLTEAQREELAKVARETLEKSERYPECYGREEWLSVVDAIAPRIARVGVEALESELFQERAKLERYKSKYRASQLAWDLSPEECCKALYNSIVYPLAGSTYTGALAKLDNTYIDARLFARAILAAAQGGDVEREPVAAKTSRDELKTRFHCAEKDLATRYGSLNAATKHRNGKQYQLTGVALSEDDLEPVAIYSDGDITWTRKLSSFLERFEPSNIAIPQPPRGRKLTDGERKQLGALIRAWDECHNPDELEQHWDATLTFVESLLAPQDETRVALGEAYLDRDGLWLTERDSYAFGHDRDDAIKQALSASTGDKFEFSVVARRVS